MEEILKTKENFVSLPRASTDLSTKGLEKPISTPARGAVILAAGRGSRMGRSKAALPWGDRSLLEAWVARFLAAGVTEIAVVLGAEMEAIRANSPDLAGLRWVCNQQAADTGPRESLLLGIDALEASAPLWFVPVDVPVVSADVLEQVRDAYQAKAADGGDQPLAALPSYRGNHGHPVLAGPDLVKRLFEGERGDRIDELLSWATRRLVVVDVDDLRVVGNMNRPQDYQAFVPPSGHSWDHCDEPPQESCSEDSEVTDPDAAHTVRTVLPD
jgi:CTP:molybdopterin cytidylyltransferase MocA